MKGSRLPTIGALRDRAAARVHDIGQIASGGAALVAIEVAGIQRFIFDVPTDGAGREVKARSFVVALLPKVLSWRARMDAGLDARSEVLVAAGRAVLIVPQDRLDQVLASLRRDARALRDATADGLAVDVASRVLPSNALDVAGAASFGNVYEALHRHDLTIARLRRAEGASDDFWRPAPAEETDWTTLGQMLRSSAGQISSIAVSHGSSDASEVFTWKALGISIAMGSSLGEVAARIDGPRLLLRTDGGEVEAAPTSGDEVSALPLAGAWIEADGAIPLDFDALAARAEGDRKLGVLRMDLDYLGDSFDAVTRGKSPRDGLRDRLALSEAVNLACGPLADALTWSAGADGPRNVQWILAGGDDLFLVGAWSEVVSVALALRDALVPELQAVVAGLANKEAAAKLDISAGVVISRARVPLAHLADEAEEQLGHAKRSRGLRNGSTTDKAAIAWGGLSVGWADWAILTRLATEVTRALRGGQVPRSLLRRLVGIHALWQRAREALALGRPRDAADTSSKRWLWAYELGRAEGGLHDEGKQLVKRLSRLALDNIDIDEAGTQRPTEQDAAALLGMVAEIAHRGSRVGGARMNGDNRGRDERHQRPSPQGSREQRGEPSSASHEPWVRAVICDGNYTSLDDEAKRLGNRLADEATKTQVRGLFSTVKRLEALRDPKELDKELAMLRPRLAYAASRTEQLGPLRDVLTEASKLAGESSRERTPRLIDLMEAIFCYSRAATKTREKAK